VVVVWNLSGTNSGFPATLKAIWSSTVTTSIFTATSFGLLAIMRTIQGRMSRTRVGQIIGLSAISRDQNLVNVSVINFVLFLLVYRFAFDSTGTINPSWLEALG
jgi:hypothetical protein